ncbi:PD-(D/E)XK nuclease family protein [Pedobacter gandavensis]|uniref:PDDEXK-like family protein n=1 Tax=Pedobacter gandavensis TaxID=2679963 RepID=UPI002931B728|nr:PD-(D/E)XK nuclease family protein [Pedobacter gandavensis]
MNETQSAPIINLLNKVEIIDMRYQKINEKDNFNIFNLLNRKFDEVHLHSRFLYELLHPKGMHGMGTAFLEKLLELLEINEFSLKNVQIQKEHRNIDLLITNETQAIIIENKLWAVDQPAQLQRYYDHISSKGFKDIRIYYLSIDGKDAEAHSIGNLKDLPNFKEILQNLSYVFDINKWLEACIKESYDKAPLRETLIQYRLLIQEISGKTMGREEELEMVNLISQNDNIIQAQKVAENWKHVRWHTEWRFWTDLEVIIAKDYQIMDLQKYSDQKISSNIHQTRNRNPWFGIMFSIGDFLGDNSCIFIERGDEDVYYGLTIIRNNSKNFNNDQKYQPLTALINSFSEWSNNDHWIGGNYCSPRINFNMFSGEDTLRLLNENYRTIYLSNLWTQMKLFINQVNQTMIQAKEPKPSESIISTTES